MDGTELVAVKHMHDGMEVASLQAFATEVDIMHGSRHPNVVQVGQAVPATARP